MVDELNNLIPFTTLKKKYIYIEQGTYLLLIGRANEALVKYLFIYLHCLNHLFIITYIFDGAIITVFIIGSPDVKYFKKFAVWVISNVSLSISNWQHRKTPIINTLIIRDL